MIGAIAGDMISSKYEIDSTNKSNILMMVGAFTYDSHNQPEGIKGAQATALAVFMARCGTDKETIRKEIEDWFDYDLNRTVETIRPAYRFNVSCQGPVPEWACV